MRRVALLRTFSIGRTVADAVRARPLGLIVTAGPILAIAIAAAAMFFIVDLHRRAVEDTENHLIGLSTVLADQADRALQAIELVQDAIIEELGGASSGDAARFVERASDQAMHDAMRAKTIALPQLNALTIIDATGKLLNFSRYWPIPEVNVADRDYFRALATDPAQKRFVSQPVQNRGDGAWTIYIARKISAPDGRFLGLVLGAVELRYFAQLYGAIAPRPDYVISMFRRDGVLLVRHPHREGAIGRGFATTGASLIAARSESGGVSRNVSPIDGQDRLVATRALANYPAILSVSRTAAASLAQWRQQAVVLGLAALLLDLVLLGLVGLGLRQSRGRERLLRAETARAAAEERERGERELRTQDARFGIALDNMTQGLCLFDADDRLIVMNARYARMHGVPEDLGRPGTALPTIRAYLAGRGIGGSLPWPGRSTGSEVDAVSVTCDLADGRAVDVVHAPIPGGGWVLTHEDVTERRRSEARIVHMARHDALTGLPNRALLRERMEDVLADEAQRDGAAVLYLDLDGFKVINDTLGHTVGDALLRAVAERLRSSLHATDFVARLGGDEFAVVQTALEQPVGATALAGRLVDLLQTPFEIQGQEIVVGTSVGIAMAGHPEATSDTLLRRADVALYQAKAAGRGTWRVFDPAMDAAVRRRHHLGVDLRRALAEGQLELHYQPLVAAGSRALRGFEALMRWRHPEHGPISPAEFIPLAEELGLIRAMGVWALTRACHDAAGWPAPIKVAVNLSSVQFVRGNLVQEVREALAASGLAADRLELEITESVLLQENEATLDILHQLRALGPRIAMDDFGTGYSSVSYLRRFPFDKLKIDQCFIRTLGREDGSIAVVRAMVGLGKALDMVVLAEGVETAEQAVILRAEGCDELQGYLFSRPLPLVEIPALIGALADAAQDAPPRRPVRRRHSGRRKAA